MGSFLFPFFFVVDFFIHVMNWVQFCGGVFCVFFHELGTTLWGSFVGHRFVGEFCLVFFGFCLNATVFFLIFTATAACPRALSLNWAQLCGVLFECTLTIGRSLPPALTTNAKLFLETI